MARKRHEEERENHERWLVSYADFITLLFAFFVVMYSVSSVDQKRVVQAEKSVRWAMHFKGKGGTDQVPIFTGNPSGSGILDEGGGERIGGTPQRIVEAEAIRERLDKSLRVVLQSPNTAQVVSVEADGRRLLIRLSAARFFDAAGAALRPDVFPVLDAIAEELAPLEKPLRVEGHTDDRAVNGPRFRNNWDLSACRAAAVVTYLEGVHHIEPSLLTAIGRGSVEPAATNGTQEGRERNRRVEIVVELEQGGAVGSTLAAAPGPSAALD